MSNILRGKVAEEHITNLLKDRKFRILERNYRVSGGEIDIIVMKGSSIRFVEVKSRKNDSIVRLTELLSSQKCKRIVHTAKTWLMGKRLNIYSTSFGFDYFGVLLGTSNQILRVDEINDFIKL